MSDFSCERCGAYCHDAGHPWGYVTGCEHYPVETTDPRGLALGKVALDYQEKLVRHDTERVELQLEGLLIALAQIEAQVARQAKTVAPDG